MVLLAQTVPFNPFNKETLDAINNLSAIATLAIIVAIALSVIFALIRSRNKSDTNFADFSKTTMHLISELVTTQKQFVTAQEKSNDILDKLQENDRRRIEMENERHVLQQKQLDQAIENNKALRDYHGSFDSSFSAIQTLLENTMSKVIESSETTVMTLDLTKKILEIIHAQNRPVSDQRFTPSEHKIVTPDEIKKIDDEKEDKNG